MSANHTHAASPAPHGANHLPTLDGWRAIAIALVLFSHGIDGLTALVNSLTGGATSAALVQARPTLKLLGLLGVQIFFGLSGFLITHRLLAEETRNGRISLPGFYLRRSFRIMPAALAFLLVIGLLAAAGVLPVTWERWLATLFFMANYSHAEPSWYLAHFWSLAVEEHFYFVWPAVFIALPALRKRCLLVLAAALAVALWRALALKFQLTDDSPAQFWGRTDIQADALLWGVLLALAWDAPKARRRLRAALAHGAAVPLLLLVLAGLQCLPTTDWKLALALLTLKAVLIPLALLATQLQAQSLVGRLLDSPAFVLVGRLSYSLYLWQQLFLVWDGQKVPALSAVQQGPWNWLALLACAALSYRFIEQPMIALGQRLHQRRRAHLACAPSA